MEKSNNFLKEWDLRRHNGKTSNSEVPIDKINIEILEIFQKLKNIAQFNLKLFYLVWMYNNSKGFLDQYARVVWVQFSNMKYS